MAKAPSKFKKNPPPKGYNKIEPTLTKYNDKLKEATHKPLQLNKSKHESLWEIAQLHHAKSRYIYQLYYEKKIISKDLYTWLVKQKIIDNELIAKWRKQGYENLCCLKCIQVKDTNHGGTCICRVPKSTLKEGNEENNKERDIRCVNCGCKGCSSGD